MSTAHAPTARKRCSRRGWRPCHGPSTAFPARKKRNRACFSPRCLEFITANQTIITARAGCLCRMATQESKSPVARWIGCIAGALTSVVFPRDCRPESGCWGEPHPHLHGLLLLLSRDPHENAARSAANPGPWLEAQTGRTQSAG